MNPAVDIIVIGGGNIGLAAVFHYPFDWSEFSAECSLSCQELMK